MAAVPYLVGLLIRGSHSTRSAAPKPRDPALSHHPGPLSRDGREVAGRRPHTRDHLRRVEVFQAGGHRWTVRVLQSGLGDEWTVEVQRDGRLQIRLSGEDLGQFLIGARRISAPTRFPVIATRAHSECGHGQATRFYSVRSGTIRLMSPDILDECGGPIFRDIDRDGSPEWIFDNYTWCGNYGDGPMNLIIYRLGRDGQLRFWKRAPNKSRGHLPDNVGITFE